MKNTKSKTAKKQQTMPEIRRSSRLYYYHKCMACNTIPDKDIKLHSFPFDNNKTRASWPPFFRALKPRYKKWHWVKLCSLHFKPECYEDDDKKVLKPRAIPTEIIHRSVPPEQRDQDEPAALQDPREPSVRHSTPRSTGEPSSELARLSENGFKMNLTSCSVSGGTQLQPEEAGPPRTAKRPLIDCRISQLQLNGSSTSRAKVEPALTIMIVGSVSTFVQDLHSTKESTLDVVYKFIKEKCLTPSEALAAESGEKVFVLDKPMLRYKLDSGLNMFLCRLCLDAIYSMSNYVQHDCRENDDKPKRQVGVPIDCDSRVNVATSLVEYIWDEKLPAGTKPVRRFSIIAEDDVGTKPWE